MMPGRYRFAWWLFRCLQWYRRRAYAVCSLWGRDGFDDDCMPRPGLYAAYDRFMQSLLWGVAVGPVDFVQNWLLWWAHEELPPGAYEEWRHGLFS